MPSKNVQVATEATFVGPKLAQVKRVSSEFEQMELSTASQEFFWISQIVLQSRGLYSYNPTSALDYMKGIFAIIKSLFVINVQSQIVGYLSF